MNAKLLLTYRKLIPALMVTAALSGCASTRTSESTGQYIDDSAITTKVKSALIEDPMVKGTAISVETYKGVVQLSGFANSRQEIRQAEAIARKVKDVKEVKNDVVLK